MINEGDDDVIKFPGAAKIRIPVTITMSLLIRERAKQQAEKRHKNFSSYIESLIIRDIQGENFKRGISEQLD